MQGWNFGLLAVAIYFVMYLIAYIRSVDHQARPRTPPEILLHDPGHVDPFRSPEEMRKRLEDFGRFNVRYNEADGLIPGRATIVDWIERVFFGDTRR